MAPSKKKPPELDVLALLDEVHGSEEGARDATVQAAVRTLEATHRQASLAMRHFERSGGRRQPPPRAIDPAGPATFAPSAGTRSPPVSPGTAMKPSAGETARPTPTGEDTAIWRPPAAGGHAAPAAAAGQGAPQANNAPATAAVDAADSPPPPADATVTQVTGAPSADDVAVYRGRGAEVVLREPTQTRVVRRPKG